MILKIQEKRKASFIEPFQTTNRDFPQRETSVFVLFTLPVLKSTNVCTTTYLLILHALFSMHGSQGAKYFYRYNTKAGPAYTRDSFSNWKKSQATGSWPMKRLKLTRRCWYVHESSIKILLKNTSNLFRYYQNYTVIQQKGVLENVSKYAIYRQVKNKYYSHSHEMFFPWMYHQCLI